MNFIKLFNQAKLNKNVSRESVCLSRARIASSVEADKVIVAPWRHLINGVGIRPASVSAALHEYLAVAKPQLVAVACCMSRRYDTWPRAGQIWTEPPLVVLA